MLKLIWLSNFIFKNQIFSSTEDQHKWTWGGVITAGLPHRLTWLWFRWFRCIGKVIHKLSMVPNIYEIIFPGTRHSRFWDFPIKIVDFYTSCYKVTLLSNSIELWTSTFMCKLVIMFSRDFFIFLYAKSLWQGQFRIFLSILINVFGGNKSASLQSIRKYPS